MNDLSALLGTPVTDPEEGKQQTLKHPQQSDNRNPTNPLPPPSSAPRFLLSTAIRSSTILSILSPFPLALTSTMQTPSSSSRKLFPPSP